MDFKIKYGHTTEASVNSFQEKIGFVLPDDYYLFLVTTNGGIPVSKTFQIDEKNGFDSIDIFFGLDMSKPFLNLNYLLELYPDRLPKGIIPIGEDPGGNYICLNANGNEDYGKIYFYDHEIDNENEDGTLNWNNLYLIANSFTEFLEKLH